MRARLAGTWAICVLAAYGCGGGSSTPPPPDARDAPRADGAVDSGTDLRADTGGSTDAGANRARCPRCHRTRRGPRRGERRRPGRDRRARRRGRRRCGRRGADLQRRHQEQRRDRHRLRRPLRQVRAGQPLFREHRLHVRVCRADRPAPRATSRPTAPASRPSAITGPAPPARAACTRETAGTVLAAQIDGRLQAPPVRHRRDRRDRERQQRRPRRSQPVHQRHLHERRALAHDDAGEARTAAARTTATRPASASAARSRTDCPGTDTACRREPVPRAACAAYSSRRRAPS